MRFSHLLVALVALSVPCVARAEDWPEFRGPTGQGIVPSGSLPTEWGPTKNIAWKQTIPGKGWSSPVVVAGRIYLTSAVPVLQSPTNDLGLSALCLDARDGKILWQREIFRENGKTAPRPHPKNSHASPTPLVYHNRLYVHFGHQGTACLDLLGKVLWRNTSLKYQPVHGNGGTPIMVEEGLVSTCDGSDQTFTVALNRDTGKVVWKTERNSPADRKFSFGTPLLITVRGQRQIISTGSNAVCAYDPSDGKEIWRVRYDGYSVIPRPVYGHGLVFISTGYNSPVLLAIRPDGQGDVTSTHIAWSMRKSVSHTPSFVLHGDELYLVSDAGIASCLDARTGKVHWQERLGETYSASPILADGKIYFQSEQGTGVVVSASKQFKLLAKNPLKERSLASYAVVDGAILLRTAEHLYRIEARP